MRPQEEYIKWLFHQRSREDDVGALARDAFANPKWDGEVKSLAKIIRQTQDDLTVYDKSCREFRDQKTQQSKSSEPGSDSD